MTKAEKPSSAPVGEAYTEFTGGGGLGPFKCGNCVHADHKEGVCNHPIMIWRSKQPRKNGKPVIDGDDCCKFVRRPGE